MQKHILTELALWRDQLTGAIADISDLLLARLAADLRSALTAVEAERQQRRAVDQGERESARLYRQRGEP